MKEIIQAFLDDNKLAIVGASNNKDNFGRMLITELSKNNMDLFPVNPSCDEVEGIKCVPTVKELPQDVENLILAVPAQLTDQIVEQCLGTPIKRIWMMKGVGKGSYTETAYNLCQQNGIDVIYGFCPMMFFGGGIHKLHFWMRKNIGKLPGEYQMSLN